MNLIKKPIAIFSFFLILSIIAFYASSRIILLFNLLYIGALVSVGVYLYSNNSPHFRNVIQLGIGLFIFVVLGLALKQNLQLSGFFYYLFLGMFQAAVMHYTFAKILGPFLFGRAWCGYACWTAMFLDLLPFKVPKSHERVENLGLLRYFIFVSTFIIVALMFYLKVPNLSNIMILMFIFGNIIYYVSGIILAYKFEDNRAFCKYFCPITVFLKPASYYSLTRINFNEETCIDCNKCIKVCPMDVDILSNERNRNNATECILCLDCIKKCPNDSLSLSVLRGKS